MGLTDILTTFKSFFSRSFWFGSFLPVAIFTGIHLVIAWWVGTGLELSTIISADTGKLITVPLALFALIVLAYAATPLIPLVQGLLDGSLLPQSVHDWLRRRHLVEARAARRRVDEATAEFNKMGELSFTTTRDLQNARNKGNEQRAFPVPREVERAAAEIGSLRTAFDRGTPPAHDDLKTAADGLTVILRRSRTSVDKELKAVKDTADKLIETMTELLGAAAAAQELQKARDDGDKNGAPADGFLDDGAFKSVEAEISALHTAVGSGASPAPASLQAVADRLAAILKAYKTGDAELKQVNDAAEKLSETQGRLTELVKDADSDTAHRLRSVLERNSRIAYDNPQATRMADIRVLAEKYCHSAYGVEFDYIWPRLQFAVPAPNATGDTGTLSDRLGMARAQIDFSVLSLALSLTVFGWLPYLLWTGGDPLKFVAIAAGAPFVTMFFYYGTLESQIAFGEVAKAAVDMHHFTVLTNLHQPMPATLADERELWGNLRNIELIRSVNVIYRHPAK